MAEDAQDLESPTSAFGRTKMAYDLIESLLSIEGDNYFESIIEIRSELDSFFENKKKVCLGEFSTIVLRVDDDFSGNLASQGSEGPRRLSDVERVACLREMKKMQKKYIRNLFEARKNILDKTHEKRVLELQKARDEALKNLERTN